MFWKKGVKLINIACISQDLDIVTPLNADLQTDSTPLSTKFSKFNKFVNDLEFDVFLTNPDSLLCKCNNFPFADRQQKHIVTGDLQIIKNSFLRKLISKDLNMEMLGL